MKQFSDKEERAIAETAEMIYNFKIGGNLENIKGTLASFVLGIRAKPLKDEVILDKLIEARRKLEERNASLALLKPKDIKTLTSLGCRMKGLQQAIDIIKQVQDESK